MGQSLIYLPEPHIEAESTGPPDRFDVDPAAFDAFIDSLCAEKDRLVELLAVLRPSEGDETYLRLRKRLTANQEAKRHFAEFLAEVDAVIVPR
jgi:hypothetical protein